MARDPLFAQAVKVTTIYTLVYVPMEMIGGISLALLVNQKVRGVRPGLGRAISTSHQGSRLGEFWN